MLLVLVVLLVVVTGEWWVQWQSSIVIEEHEDKEIKEPHWEEDDKWERGKRIKKTT